MPVTLVTAALSSTETPVLTRATRRIIPEDAILQGSRTTVTVKTVLVQLSGLTIDYNF
jgi:hypothetical protein